MSQDDSALDGVSFSCNLLKVFWPFNISRVPPRSWFRQCTWASIRRIPFRPCSGSVSTIYRRTSWYNPESTGRKPCVKTIFCACKLCTPLAFLFSNLFSQDFQGHTAPTSPGESPANGRYYWASDSERQHRFRWELCYKCSSFTISNSAFYGFTIRKVSQLINPLPEPTRGTQNFCL